VCVCVWCCYSNVLVKVAGWVIVCVVCCYGNVLVNVAGWVIVCVCVCGVVMVMCW
jgi:hypothetical protein